MDPRIATRMYMYYYYISIITLFAAKPLYFVFE